MGINKKTGALAAQSKTLYEDRRIGLLVLICQVSHQAWLCACDCGRFLVIGAKGFGRAKSCGCLRRAIRYKAEYKSWAEMKARCLNFGHKKYNNYGGRGIKICDRWLDKNRGFENFLADMGKKPGREYTLDRIDVNGDYCPENCRWATQLQQQNNRRNNRLIEYQGVVRTLPEWCRILGLPYNTIRARLWAYAYTPQQAFERPVTYVQSQRRAL